LPKFKNTALLLASCGGGGGGATDVAAADAAIAPQFHASAQPAVLDKPLP